MEKLVKILDDCDSYLEFQSLKLFLEDIYSRDTILQDSDIPPIIISLKEKTAYWPRGRGSVEWEVDPRFRLLLRRSDDENPELWLNDSFLEVSIFLSNDITITGDEVTVQMSYNLEKLPEHWKLYIRAYDNYIQVVSDAVYEISREVK